MSAVDPSHDWDAGPPGEVKIGTLLVSLVGLIMMVFLAQGCAGVAFGDAFLRRLGFKGCIHAAFVAGGLLGPAVFAAAPVASALKTFDWRTMLLDPS